MTSSSTLPPFIKIEQSKLKSLKGRIALITGGSSGIGLSTTILLTSLGAKVIIGDINPPPTTLLSNPLIIYQHCEVNSYTSLLSLFKRSKTSFGFYPDIVFANAGIGERGDLFEEVSDEQIEIEPKHEVVQLDLIAVANTVRIAYWGIKKDNSTRSTSNKIVGNIIITASVAGLTGQKGLAMYNSAKHGVVGIVRSLKITAPKNGVSISYLAPAITSTPLLTSSAGDYKEVVSSLVSTGVPMNSAEEVSLAVAYMIDQDGYKANGMGIMVQGGKFIDVEKSIQNSRKVWMGNEMDRMYKGGKGSDPFVKLQAASSKL